MDITTQKLLKVSITLLINCSFYFHACQAVDFIKNGLYVADSLYPPFVYGDFIYYVDTSNYLSLENTHSLCKQKDETSPSANIMVADHHYH